jgi:glycosyl transferase family 25
MTSSLLRHALYINLESRPDRLALILQQLKSIGVVSPERVVGVRTEPGAIGCTLSHIHCLKLAQTRNWDHVCIFEDDFKCIDPERFKQSLSEFENNHIADGVGNWSVLMLGGNCFSSHTNLPGVDYCIQIGQACCTVGYVVKKHMYSTLIKNFEEGVTRLIREPSKGSVYALDIFWLPLQRDGTWYLLTPLTVTQQSGYSDIEKRVVTYDNLLLKLPTVNRRSS